MWRLMKETPEKGVDTLVYEDPANEDLADFDSAIGFFREYIWENDLFEECEEKEEFVPVSNGTRVQSATYGYSCVSGELIDWGWERQNFYKGNPEGADKKIFYHDSIDYDKRENRFYYVKWYEVLTEEDVLS